MARPKHSTQTGGRIKYADSPPYDERGDRILYTEDRSNSANWDQASGLRNEVTVDVTIEGQAGGGTPVAAKTVSITRFADQGYEQFPTVFTEPGRTIGDVRSEFRDQLSLGDTVTAIVRSVSQQDSYVLKADDTVVFKEANKRRGAIAA